LNFDHSYAWTGPTFPYSSPRAWQARALPVAVSAMMQGKRSIVRAIMGSGKAALAAEICFVSITNMGSESIVVSAPSVNLVDQLAETIGNRLGEKNVGKYYPSAKQFDRPVVVACLDSLPSLADALLASGRSVPLWIADEAHRCETETVETFVSAMRPERRVGLTATPYLSSGGLESWDEVVFSYSVEEALEDGVIVPFKVESWVGDPDAPIDVASLELAKRGKELGPGVINASTIEDAEAFGALCHEFGIRVRTVHSRKSKAENAATIEALRVGELDAVVHVSMLQEGVDLPWLRWILLRRNTQSRVRFAQEVGRVLRACPGKDFATVFDPLELFTAYKITLEAVLSGGSTKGEKEVDPVEESAEEIEKILDEDLPEFEKFAAAVTSCESYLRRVVLTLDAVGISDQKVASRSMRQEQPTEAQIRVLKSLKNVLAHEDLVLGLPDRHRFLLEYCRRNSPRTNKGVASDLISILLGLRSAKRWPTKIAELMI